MRLFRYIIYIFTLIIFLKLISKRKINIPKVIYKTGPLPYDELTDDIKNIFKELEKQGYIIEYFDDERCKSFIRKHFDIEVFNAWDKLIPGAYKADLFRYCVLYKNGGIYSDLSHNLRVPMRKIVNHYSDRLVLVKDIPINEIPGIQISFMAASKGQNIFKMAIKAVIENCQKEYFGSNPLCPTGPALFHKILTTEQSSDVRIELYQKTDYSLNFIESGKVAIITKRKTHQENLNNQPHYGELWKTRNIYKSKFNF